MPGLDGTGPRGIGPMTGRGRGLCVLQLPTEPGEPVTGVAGRSGRPVRAPTPAAMELDRLLWQAGHMERVLGFIRARIEQLESRRR